MPSVASVLRARLAEQREALTRAEDALRAGEPEGLHDLRVAIRRLRSVLATFRPALDRSVTEPLRDELRWVSVRLGKGRDVEVATEHIERLLDEAAPVGLDDAVSGLRARLHLDLAAATDGVDETLASTKYAAVVILLDGIVAKPPFTAKADKEAKPFVRKRVDREIERVVARIEAARATTDPELHAARLHDVRKAVKRLRYAAEVGAPVSGTGTRSVAESAEEAQDIIGQHHDATVTRATLHHLAVDLAGGEAAAFLLGHLDADEQRSLSELERRATEALDALEQLAATRE